MVMKENLVGSYEVAFILKIYIDWKLNVFEPSPHLNIV